MLLVEAEFALLPDVRRDLLRLARQSIEHGVAHQQPVPVGDDWRQRLPDAQRASFVTLMLDHDLRGCIGSLEAVRHLAEDVAGNAYRAAFHDPRFHPVTKAELTRLEIHLSILTAPVLLPAPSEAHLLALIEPGRDGLILEDAGRRGTFLPSVWDTLPEPLEFLRQLKRKAGFPPGHWSATTRIWRYRTVVISEGAD